MPEKPIPQKLLDDCATALEEDDYASDVLWDDECVTVAKVVLHAANVPALLARVETLEGLLPRLRGQIVLCSNHGKARNGCLIDGGCSAARLVACIDAALKKGDEQGG